MQRWKSRSISKEANFFIPNENKALQRRREKKDKIGKIDRTISSQKKMNTAPSNFQSI